MSSYIQMMANSTEEATQARRAAEGSHCLDPRMFALFVLALCSSLQKTFCENCDLGGPMEEGLLPLMLVP